MGSTKPNSRLQRWATPEHIDVMATTGEGEFTSEDEAIADALWARRQANVPDEAGGANGLSQEHIMRAARELIYTHEDGRPTFHVVGYTINVRRGQLQLGAHLKILTSGESREEIAQEVRDTLAHAHIYEVPVVPDTDALVDELAGHYRDLMLRGFTAPDGKGGRQRLKLVRAPGDRVGSLEHLRELTLTEPLHPAEIALIRRTVQDEIARFSEAQALVGALDVAIASLTVALEADSRNESALQRCLTENPVLFGLEYREVLPKHRLGSEFEMDYALKRFSGLVDILEIEASTLPLFNRRGDPSQHLVHAEQQVIDWLAWIEANHPYAVARLPGITMPVGYVVIGRSASLRDNDRTKLLQRNAVFRDQIRIMTYDDVLGRAEGFREVLTSAATQSA